LVQKNWLTVENFIIITEQVEQADTFFSVWRVTLREAEGVTILIYAKEGKWGIPLPADVCWCKANKTYWLGALWGELDTLGGSNSSKRCLDNTLVGVCVVLSSSV